MRKEARLTAGVAGILLLLAPACSGRNAGPATVPAPTSTSTPSADRAAAVESVNRVLAGLDGVMGDLQRILVKNRRITPEVTDRLRAIYTGPELLNQVDAFRSDVDGGLLGYKPTPGNRVTTVSRLITASPICMFAEVRRDYSPVAVGLASKGATLYVVLVTKDEADDPKHLNPTPWSMLYDGVQADGSQPDDVCR